jgi:hypothetical protein
MTQPRQCRSLLEMTRAKVETAFIARVELITPKSFGHNSDHC